MKRFLLAVAMTTSLSMAWAQNYNNGENLSRFVTSDQFASMTPEQLQPIEKKIQAHLDKCVAGTIKQLQLNPKRSNVSAKQVQEHYRLWKPYYKSVCDVYATEQEDGLAAREALKMRCEVFSQSSFYSNLLAYQHAPVQECQSSNAME